jgi:hypothetical protein
METVLRGPTYEACLVCLGYVIVIGRTFQEQPDNLRKVFQRFRRGRLKPNLDRGQGLTSCEKPTYTVYRGHLPGSRQLWNIITGSWCFSKSVDERDLQYVAFKVSEIDTRCSLKKSLHLKVDSSQQGARSSGTPPRDADGIRQPREAEKTTGGRDSQVVRNPPS